MSKDIIPNGCWPVMLTPFKDDRSFDWKGVDALVDYYAKAQVAGIQTVRLTVDTTLGRVGSGTASATVAAAPPAPVPAAIPRSLAFTG